MTPIMALYNLGVACNQVRRLQDLHERDGNVVQ